MTRDMVGYGGKWPDMRWPNGARLAVSSPWLLLLFLSLRPQAVAAYDTPAGLLILSIGAGLCVVAYQIMLRIAVLPSEPRVLQ